MTTRQSSVNTGGANRRVRIRYGRGATRRMGGRRAPETPIGTRRQPVVIGCETSVHRTPNRLSLDAPMKLVCDGVPGKVSALWPGMMCLAKDHIDPLERALTGCDRLTFFLA